MKKNIFKFIFLAMVMANIATAAPKNSSINAGAKPARLNSFSEEILLIRTLIAQNQLAKAEQALKAIRPKDKDEEAAVAFQKARVYVRRGKYLEAKSANSIAIKNGKTKIAATYNQACFSCLQEKSQDCLVSLMEFSKLTDTMSPREISLYLDLVFRDRDLKFARNNPNLRVQLGTIVAQLVNRKTMLDQEAAERESEDTPDWWGCDENGLCSCG